METVQKQQNQTMIDLQYMVDMLDRTYFNAFCIKLFSGAVVTVTAFFIPIQSFIWMTLGLVLGDFISGIIASKFPKDKTKAVNIQSSKLMRSVYKMSLYGLSIIIWHGISITFFPSIQLAYMAAAFICFTELQSIDENYHTIIGESLLTKMKTKIKLK
jgi:hypothetical protein